MCPFPKRIQTHACYTSLFLRSHSSNCFSSNSNHALFATNYLFCNTILFEWSKTCWEAIKHSTACNIRLSFIYIDVNECFINNGGCQHNCTNTEGNSSCSCNTGYSLDSNGFNCTGNLKCFMYSHNFKTKFQKLMSVSPTMVAVRMTVTTLMEAFFVPVTPDIN